MSEDFKLTPESTIEFVENLSNPPEPNDNLKELKVKYQNEPKPEDVYSPKTNESRYEDALREILGVIFGKTQHETHLGKIFYILNIVEKALGDDGTASSKEPCIIKEPEGVYRLENDSYGGTDGESDPRRQE